MNARNVFVAAINTNLMFKDGDDHDFEIQRAAKTFEMCPLLRKKLLDYVSA